MKYKAFTILSLFFLITSFVSSQNGYNIQLKIKGFENKDVILGYYSNKSMYITDTVTFNSNSIALFKNEEPLPGGLYFFYLPNEKHFDILIDKEQNIKFETDTLDLVGNLKINGSKESSLFLSYQLYLSKMQKQAGELHRNMTSATNDTDKSKFQSELAEVNSTVEKYMKDEREKNPNTLYAAFIKGMREPDIPEFDIPNSVSNRDSVLQLKQYIYYANHYLDNIDLSDKRFIRLPYFVEKLDTYFDKVLIQHPDSITKAAIATIEKTKRSKEMYQFVTQYLFNKINDNKIMGMENAMVALADKYYLSGEAFWASDDFLEKLKKHVEQIRPTLIGKTAHNLFMESITGEYFKLHEINAPITILIFYEPSCGHCKKEIPLIYNDVFLKYRDQGLKAFVVYSMNDKKEWEEFINEHELYDWINVYDPYHETNFRYHFDIRATPTIFILDKDKNIIAKRLDVNQIANFVEHKLKNQ